MNGWIFPFCTHTSSLSRGIIQLLCHLLPKCLSEVQTHSLSLLELCAASKALTLASIGFFFLLISSHLASRKDDLNQCSEARISGEENGKVFLSRRKACGQSGWESSGCVLEVAELAGKGGGDACWNELGGDSHSPRRFPLFNRSRADVLVVGEMKELQLGRLQLWVEENLWCHWGQLRSCSENL